MKLEREREQIVYYCNLMLKSGLTKGTGGNISLYNSSKNLVAISPSGVPYNTLQKEDIVIITLEGEVVEGNYKPSTEWPMHTEIYKNRRELGAVVHTHSVFSKTLACLREDLPAVSYMVAVAGEDIKCAEYASFGTKQLGKNAIKAMYGRKAVLLANHGLVAVGETIVEAFNIAEQIELCAEVYIRARGVGTPIILDKEEMTVMLKRFKTYGQPDNSNTLN